VLLASLTNWWKCGVVGFDGVDLVENCDVAS